MGRGRPRKFNEHEVLGKAAAVFSQNGYSRTTMQALSAAMGMGEQSIYNAFGTKEQVYVAALGHYCDQSGAMFARLEAPDAGVAAIRRFFNEIVDYFTQPGGAPPCLAVESATRPDVTGECAARRGSEHLQRVERAFRLAVQRAMERGELECDDPTTLARYLFVSMQGLAVAARDRNSKFARRPALRKVVARVLAALD